MIRQLLLESAIDVACITEAYRNFFEDGHCIESEAAYGYPVVEGRRKAILWSRNSWSHIDSIGNRELPPGRFVTGLTETPIGPLRFTGVCVPWRLAHVNTGRRDAAPWSEHLKYISGLARIVRENERRCVILGDFNQRLPRAGQPVSVFDALTQALGEAFEIVTQGCQDITGKSAIDHLACTNDLSGAMTSILPARLDDGTTLSDHFGMVVELRLR